GEPAERSLAIWEQAHRPGHPGVAVNLGNHAVVLRAAGDPIGSRSRIERARAIVERVLGPDHPRVANALRIRASVLRDLGEDEAADACDARAAGIRGEP